MPIAGQMKPTKTASTIISRMLAGMPAEEELARGELLALVGDGVGRRADQQQEGHPGHDQRGEQDHLRRHAEVGREHQRHGQRDGDGRDVHDQVGHHQHEEARSP